MGRRSNDEMAGCSSDDSHTLAMGSPAPSSSKRGRSSMPTCHLCEERISEINPKKALRSCYFHDRCFNAHRSFRRLHDDPTEADTFMLNDTDAWRAEVQPLIRGAGGVRDGSARSKVKAKIFETAKVTANMTVEDKLVLNRQRFRAYMRFWENMSADEADGEFNLLLRKQKTAYSDNFEDRVAVADNTKVRKMSGNEVRTISRVTHDGEAASSSHDVPGRRCEKTAMPPRPLTRQPDRPTFDRKASSSALGLETPRTLASKRSRTKSHPESLAGGSDSEVILTVKCVWGLCSGAAKFSSDVFWDRLGFRTNLIIMDR